MRFRLFYSFLCVSFFFSVFQIKAQKADSSFPLLASNMDTRIIGLSGHNISLVTSRPIDGVENPAMYSFADSKAFGIGFSQDGAKNKLFSARFLHPIGDRHTYAINSAYLSYGTIEKTDASGISLGSMQPKDILISGSYSYLLSSKWAGGATIKSMFLNYDSYNSTSIIVDVGLNYYDEEKDLSCSLLLQNLGVTLSNFNDKRSTTIPFSMLLGISKGLEHLPITIHTTFINITDWSKKHYFLSEQSKSLSVSQNLLNHLTLGIEYKLLNTCHIDIGYNFRRAYELKSVNGGQLNGLTIGGGIQIGQLGMNLAYAKGLNSLGTMSVGLFYVIK